MPLAPTFCKSQVNKVYDKLYNDLTKLNSEKEQSAYLSKAKEDFKTLDKWTNQNLNEDIIGCIIVHAQKPDGTIKLYNQKALKKRCFSRSKSSKCLYE